MKEKIIHTNKLCKSFSNGGNQQHVLKNLDLDIYKGDFTVIMGASGSGKSTLLYALSGMDTPTLGDVYYGEKNIANLSQDKLAVFRRDHCGFIFQQMYLLDNMSILDNILTKGLLHKKSVKEVKQDAYKLLQRVNLDESIWNKFPSQLSGGEAQRAAIIRAVIDSPEIVFADEPTGALNHSSGKLVLDILSDLNAEGQSIVMVTHDIQSAVRGNRIIYLLDGMIRGELTLSRYEAEQSARVDELNSFLKGMRW